MDHIDVQFACFSEEDQKVLAKIMKVLTAKGFRYERLNDMPIHTMSPSGPKFGQNVFHRFFLKEKAATLKFIPVAKEGEKETAKK
jgi:hypothetical protein